MARTWLTVVCACGLAIACKHDPPKAHRSEPADWIDSARAKSAKLDRPVIITPAPLVARVDASWSCAPNDAKETVCTKDHQRLSWKLEEESSVKPDATLIAAEEAEACTSNRWRHLGCTIGRSDIGTYHGIFNERDRGNHLVFIGWNGETPNRTRLTIAADGGGEREDVMAVMMTTVPK